LPASHDFSPRLLSVGTSPNAATCKANTEKKRLFLNHVGVFEPDEVVILLAAFDKSWGAVQASGVRYPADKLEFVRAILAKHIIAAAMEGERDVGRLRDGALLALAQSNLRSGSASLLA